MGRGQPAGGLRATQPCRWAGCARGWWVSGGRGQPGVQRWLRHWYLDRTDGGSSSNGDLTIAFDFSEGADSTPGAGANYRLLYRSGTSGDFAPVTVASTSVVDDQVRFQVAEANLADGYYTLGTTDAGGSPLLVQLVSFTAAPQPGGARVAWETASEIDNAGFNLYRQAGEGAWIRLNAALIPAQGGPTQGASYTFDDVGVPPPEVPSGTSYSYWLEDVDVHGQTTRHGPVVVDLGELPTSVGLIGFGASGASALVALLGVIAGALALGAGGLAWSRRCRRA